MHEGIIKFIPYLYFFYLLNCDMLSFGAVYFAAQGVFNCEVCRERSKCLHPNFGPHS